MDVTKEQVRKFLESYRDLLRKISDCEELYERLYASVTSPVSHSTSEDHVSGASGDSKDKMGDNILLLSDAEDKLYKLIAKSKRRRKEIEFCIDALPEDRMKRVCELTYLDFWDRSLISRELKISRDVVTKDRIKAIKWLSENIKFKGA